MKKMVVRGGKEEKWHAEREGKKKTKQSNHKIFPNAHKMATAMWSAAAGTSSSSRLLPAAGAFVKAAIDPRPGH